MLEKSIRNLKNVFDNFWCEKDVKGISWLIWFISDEIISASYHWYLNIEFITQKNELKNIWVVTKVTHRHNTFFGSYMPLQIIVHISVWWQQDNVAFRFLFDKGGIASVFSETQKFWHIWKITCTHSEIRLNFRKCLHDIWLQILNWHFRFKHFFFYFAPLCATWISLMTRKSSTNAAGFKLRVYALVSLYK